MPYQVRQENKSAYAEAQQDEIRRCKGPCDSASGSDRVRGRDETSERRGRVATQLTGVFANGIVGQSGRRFHRALAFSAAPNGACIGRHLTVRIKIWFHNGLFILQPGVLWELRRIA